MLGVDDGLARILLELAEREEARRREERRRREIEERLRQERLMAIRLRRLKEEAERRKREELAKKVMLEIDRTVKELKGKKLQEYMNYYNRYHDLKRTADWLREQLIKTGLDISKAYDCAQKFVELCMEKWPEPYRTKCQFTPIEMAAFLTDPIQSEFWISMLPSRASL